MDSPPNSPLVKWQSRQTPGPEASPIPVHAIEQSPGGTSRFQRPPHAQYMEPAPESPQREAKVAAEAEAEASRMFPELQLGRRGSMRALHQAIQDMVAVAAQTSGSDDEDLEEESVGSAVREAETKILKRRGSLLQHPLGSVGRFIERRPKVLHN